MDTETLSRMFRPESVAIIGASEKKGQVGYALMRNLIDGGFKGDIYPVNPNYAYVMDIPVKSSIKEIENPVDLMVVATPIGQVPEIIEACGQAGAAGAVVISAGAKEAGEQGRIIESRIKHAARQHGIRILGPNSIGIANTDISLNASFMSGSPEKGRIAFLSQSGAVCASVQDLAQKENLGFSHIISMGDMLDVDFSDMLDYLSTSRKVDSIIMYMETMTNIRKFMSAARAVSRIKPIICLKSGRTSVGARAAALHTGAMAGEDAVYDAAFDRAGILRVDTFEELFDYTRIFARQQQPKGKRLAVITNAGGPGVMAVDALAANGLEPAILAAQTIEALDTTLEKTWSRSNPVDVLADASSAQIARAVTVAAQAPEVDGILMIHSPMGLFDPADLARDLAGQITALPCPVITVWLGGPRMVKAQKILAEHGGLTYDTPEKAARAFAGMNRYHRNLEMLQQIPVRRDIRLKVHPEQVRTIINSYIEEGRPLLNEMDAKAVLGAYGIPVNRTQLAPTKEEAVQKAEEMGFPVVLKIDSPDIIHKSDAGGICLNLCSAQAVKDAFDRIMSHSSAAFPDAEILGVSVQSMVQSGCYELFAGARLDQQFGPVLEFGSGGAMTDIYQDTALALPPLNSMLAAQTINATKISKVMNGFRQFKAVDMTQAENLLIRLSRLVTDFSQITEVTINPVVVTNGHIIAVDARIRVAAPAVPAPEHLIISPYPAWQEQLLTTQESEQVLIRPVKPEDAAPIMTFFENLSPQTVYLRFFTPLKKLSNRMLLALTQIDYDREVALVAIFPPQSGERIIGTARIISTGNHKEGEFAIMLADSWQGKGIGAALLKSCLAFAKRYGLKRVYGTVLRENRQMLRLADKLGFKKTGMPHSGEVEIDIDIEHLDVYTL